MGMGQNRPKGSAEHVAWNYLRLVAGGTLKCHLAGKWIGVDYHWDSKSVPCRLRISDGQLGCKYCAAGFAPLWHAYVPVVDTSRVRYVFCLNAENSIPLDAIEPGEPVLVAKQRLQGCPLTIRAEAWASPLKLGKGGFPPADLTKWILHVWKDAELAECVRSKDRATTPRPDITLVTPDSTIVVSGAASEKREVDQAEEMAKVKALLRQRAGISNGVHESVKRKGKK